MAQKPQKQQTGKRHRGLIWEDKMNTILELLTDFLQIGLFSIGGGYAVIPLIQEHVVDLRGWLSIQEFTDIITISQMTPGPLAVNTSTFVGLQIGGIPGAVAATLGCVFSGFVISLILCRVFDRYKKSEYGLKLLKGLKAASAGLIVSAAMTIIVMAFSWSGENMAGSTDPLAKISNMMQNLNWIAAAIFLSALILVRKVHLNPILVMGICGLVGAAVYR